MFFVLNFFPRKSPSNRPKKTPNTTHSTWVGVPGTLQKLEFKSQRSIIYILCSQFFPEKIIIESSKKYSNTVHCRSVGSMEYVKNWNLRVRHQSYMFLKIKTPYQKFFPFSYVAVFALKSHWGTTPFCEKITSATNLQRFVAETCFSAFH